MHLSAELIGRFKKNRRALKSISLLGNKGGLCRGKGDLDLIIKSKSTARIQEMHILIGYILCELIEKNMSLNT